MPAGRLSSMTPNTVGKLELAFAMDYTDTEACFFAGIHRDTLYAYQSENPEFSDRKAVLRRSLAMKSKTILAASIQPELFEDKDGKTILKVRGNVELALTYLQNKYPNEFGKTRAYSSQIEDQLKQQVDHVAELLASFEVRPGDDEPVQATEPGHGSN